MNRTKAIAGLLAITLTSAALFAAPGMKADANSDKTVTKTEALAAADSRFIKMDANNDGKLDSTDKAAKIKMHFAEMDADKNGSISETEFVAAHEARAEMHRDRHTKRMGQVRGDSSEAMHAKGRGGGRHGDGMRMLAMADTNGDKAITKAEFRTAAEARFAKADANGDGSITADERKAGRKDRMDRRPVANGSE